jgi:hypothetical protein
VPHGCPCLWPALPVPRPCPTAQPAEGPQASSRPPPPGQSRPCPPAGHPQADAAHHHVHVIEHPGPPVPAPCPPVPCVAFVATDDNERSERKVRRTVHIINDTDAGRGRCTPWGFFGSSLAVSLTRPPCRRFSLPPAQKTCPTRPGIPRDFAHRNPRAPDDAQALHNKSGRRRLY